jgi:hypothetical protein
MTLGPPLLKIPDDILDHLIEVWHKSSNSPRVKLCERQVPVDGLIESLAML